MKKNKIVLLIGLPTVINILVLLAFACVSMLSLSRASADHMAAKHNMRITQDYFAADSRAQLILAELYELTTLSPEETGSEMEATLNDEGIAARFDHTAGELAFRLPAGKAGTLSVRLQLQDTSAYSIAEWRFLPHETPEE